MERRSSPLIIGEFPALGVSAMGANGAIAQLEDLGILVKAKGDERNRAWVAVDIVVVLDNFAERSGRRQRGSEG